MVLAAAGIALALIFGASSSSSTSTAAAVAVRGKPTVAIISPRNGSRQSSHAVVVKLAIENFQLAPGEFGNEPQLGEGNVRFSLKRIPNCVDPVKLQRAIDSPIGKGRLIGASFDFPRYAGPNGILAERIGSAGSYSPGTRPEIFYHSLPPGFYRLVVNLAENNGATTPSHAVTTFQVTPRPGHGPKPCSDGKVPSTKAASNFG